jgi:site-specific DNA-cytosine methylase
MSNRTKRLSRLGNAVVPDCAQWIAERLLEFDQIRSTSAGQA